MKELPGGAAALERCKPVYEQLPGWDGKTASVTKYRDLPEGARVYVERLQELVGCTIDIISTGPHRHETITVQPVI